MDKRKKHSKIPKKISGKTNKTPIKLPPALENNLYILPILLFLIICSFFISADPPLSLTGHQAPWVEPPTYLETVRVKILTGEWGNMRNVLYFPLYIYPIYWVSLIFGNGYFSLRILSIIMSSLSMFFLISALKKYLNRYILFIGSFIVLNYVLMMYTRLGFFYVFVNFWGCLTIYFYSKGPTKNLYLFLCGVSSCCAFFTQLLSFLFIFPFSLLILLDTIFIHRKYKTIISYISGFICVTILYLLILDVNISELYNYIIFNFFEKRGALSGEPSTLSNVISLFQTKLFYGRMPFLFILASLFSLLIISNIKNFFKNLHWFERLALLWFGFEILFFSLIQYRAIRYHILVIPPMILLMFGFLRNYYDNKSFIYERKKYVFNIIIYIFTILIFYILIKRAYAIPLPNTNLYISLIAIFYIGLFAFFIINSKIKLPESYKYPGIVFILIFSVFINIFQYYDNFSSKRNSVIIDGGNDLPVVLNNNAVITGMTSIIFLFNNDLDNPNTIKSKSVAVSLGSMNISHYILVPNVFKPDDLPNKDKFIWVKNYTYRGSKALLFRDPSHPSYRPSDFEKGVEFFMSKKFQESFNHFNIFYAKHPTQIDNLNYLAILNWIGGNKNQSIEFFKKILEHHKRSLFGRINLAFALAQTEDFDIAYNLLLDVKKDFNTQEISRLTDLVKFKKKPEFRGFYTREDFFLTNYKDFIK